MKARRTKRGPAKRRPPTVHALTVYGTRCGKGRDGTFLWGPRRYPGELRVPLTCLDCRRLVRADLAREARERRARRVEARIR